MPRYSNIIWIRGAARDKSCKHVNVSLETTGGKRIGLQLPMDVARDLANRLTRETQGA